MSLILRKRKAHIKISIKERVSTQGPGFGNACLGSDVSHSGTQEERSD